MKSEKILCIVFCVMISLLALLSVAGIITLARAEISYATTQLIQESCTFIKYEYEVIERRKGDDIERYYIYVKEYTEPLEIDNIVSDQVNKIVLRDLQEGDMITLSIDQKRNVLSAEHNGQYIVSYEDYVAKHSRNNIVGIIVSALFFCFCVIFLIVCVVRYKKTGMVSDILAYR